MDEIAEFNDGMRIVFRPTRDIYDRLHNLLLNSGRYRHLSEVIRHALSTGLDEIERGYKK